MCLPLEVIIDRAWNKTSMRLLMHTCSTALWLI